MSTTGLKAATYGAGDSFPFTEDNPSTAPGFCWHCGRDLKGEGVYMIEVVDGGKIRKQDGTEADEADAGYMGWYEVGRYCGRKFDADVRVWVPTDRRAILAAQERAAEVITEVTDLTEKPVREEVPAVDVIHPEPLEVPEPATPTAPEGSGSQKARCLALAQAEGWTITVFGRGASTTINAIKGSTHLMVGNAEGQPVSNAWKAMRRAITEEAGR